MLLQFLASHKSLGKAIHNVRLLLCKPAGICGIDGGKVRVEKGIVFPVQKDRSFFIVNLLKQISVPQAELRMAPDRLSLRFKLNDGDRLVHFQVQLQLRLLICIRSLQCKTGTGIVSVGVQGKVRQRKQVNAVPILQNVEIPIPCTDADHICNAAELPCCRPHPQHIVVSPLYVHRVIGHQLVHNDMRSRSPVKDIPDNVQVIHGQTLNQLTERRNKLTCPPHADNRLHNGPIVGFLVCQIPSLCDQLLHHIGKLPGESLSHLGARILAGRPAAYLNQPVKGNLIPVFRIFLLFQNPLHLFPRIVDQRRQRLLVLTAQGISEHIVNLSLH